VPTIAKKLPERAVSRIGMSASAEQLAIVAKALGHPARIDIVRLLHEKQSCIGCDIVDEVGLAQSTVSEHLRILKSAGVITGEIERPRVCYSLNSESLAPLAHLLTAVLDKAGKGDRRGSPCGPSLCRKTVGSAQRSSASR